MRGGLDNTAGIAVESLNHHARSIAIACMHPTASQIIYVIFNDLKLADPFLIAASRVPLFAPAMTNLASG